MKLVDYRDKVAVGRLYLEKELEDALGEILLAWRYKRLLCQSEAAKVFGVHRTTYADWEASAVEIRVGTLKRIMQRGQFEPWQVGLGEHVAPNS